MLIDAYRRIWNFDSEITFWLKLFTGEISPSSFQSKLSSPLRKKNRIFLDQLPRKYIEKIIRFFETNRILIVSDVLKGRGGLSADWMLVTIAEAKTTILRYILRDINFTMNFFGQGQVKISPKGSLKIGKITMQRKGGTPDPSKLQFKISPGQLS